MSEWKDTDEVVTTYGSIQLSLEQSYSAGQKTERERIIKLIERTSFIWMGDVELIDTSRDELIKLIKGAENE
jgi:hypothetical protein